MLSSISVAQAATVEQHMVVAPTCLISDLATNYKVVLANDSLALLETNNKGLEMLIEAKNQRRETPCGGFIDVSDAWKAYQIKGKTIQNQAKSFLANYAHSTKSEPAQYSIHYTAQVNQLLATVNSQNIWDDLSQFSDTSAKKFPDRYAGSDNGVKAAQWIKDKIEALVVANNRSDITVYTVATGKRYKQPSVVVKVGNSNEPGIVIGGHMDTLPSTREVKPGADDDGSGSMTAMEVARAVINSGMQFKKPIYFIWYSAEEMGLVGSDYVVKDFKSKNIPVEAVLQMDMTGYSYNNDPTMWLITDNINNDLTNYIEKLITTYVKVPVDRTSCGYACSDHASWDKAGVKAAFPFEGAFGKDNPYIHTAKDTIDVLSLDHMTNFAKLGVAFAVELAEPVNR
jgi:leucyl aminopeptidase